MNNDKIKAIQNELNRFFDDDNNIITFEINCDIKDRIKIIYKIIFPGLKKFKFYFIFFISRLAQFIDLSVIKVMLYRLIGVKIGRGVFISPDVIIDPHFPYLIKIEDYSILGWGTKLFTHEYADNIYRIGKITIKKGAVIGSQVTLRGGVCIGEMSEVPYGCIVIKDVPARTKAKTVLIQQVKNKS